ncbi:MAG: hypothetical protein WBB25_08930 [Sulfitobacter sp.]
MSKLLFVTRAAAFTAICMALTPALFSVGPYLEARFFPVVRGTTILNEELGAGGVSFFVRFRKVRQCTFLGLAWYVGEVRVPVIFAPTARNSPRSRPLGGQHTGPWLVSAEQSTVRGNTAFAYHRCHPLWVTISEFYPG